MYLLQNFSYGYICRKIDSWPLLLLPAFRLRFANSPQT